VARFNGIAESATALTTGFTSNSSTIGGLFLVLRLNAASSFKIRRLTFGVRAGVGAPTSQQMSIACLRTTNAGAGATAQVLNQLDPNSFATNVRADVTAWTTTPTSLVTVNQAAYLFEVSFNTQSGVDLPWELLEELYTSGSGNGIAFFNNGNALPTSHLYTASFEIEE